MNVLIKNQKKAVLLLGVLFVALVISAYATYYYAHSILDSSLIVLGFILAIIDTSIGMGFGTIGTPVLLISGFTSRNTVPAVLMAQLLAATFGTVLHHKYRNVNLLNVGGRDAKIAMVLVSLGVIGAIAGALLAIKLPGAYVNTYIGFLVIVMGAILVLKPKLVFSWAKIFAISLISGFNKTISGGGYGPVTTSSLMVTGNEIRNSVGITVFSVAVINAVGFALYLISGSITNYVLLVTLAVGAIIGSQLGPRITSRLEMGAGIWIPFASIVIILGAFTILTAWVKVL